MIDAEQFIAAAAARGYDCYAGVPCSFLTPLINCVAGVGPGTYVAAASEGEAIAIAAGTVPDSRTADRDLAGAARLA